ncbi:hypothetical protein GB937_006376 [Aspergillus fischeri]|nr:hypothetical protein GB937_006376 [Aspergillus fischeri]
MSSSQKGPPSSPCTPLLSVSNPVNSNFVNQCLTLLASGALKLFNLKKGMFSYQQIEYVLNMGYMHLPKALIMYLISQHTSIPVLKVLCVFTHSVYTYIIIERIKRDIISSGWKYTSAHQVNPQNSFWVYKIDKFLQAMPEELAMERIRQKDFGDILNLVDLAE